MNSNSLCKIPVPKKRDVLFLLILIFVAVLFHLSISFAGHLPLDEDSLLFFYPLRALHSDPFVGFWDPYLFCGFPREANPQSQLLYAPNILFQFLPTNLGFSLLIIGHIALGGILMYLLLRGLTLSAQSSLFGAFVFLVSAFWRCKITNLGLLEGISWIPGVLFFYLLSLESGRWVPRMACALFLGMVILAGVPHTVVYTLVMLFFFTLSFILLKERPLLSTLSVFVSVIGSSAILTIGMWLPALQYFPESGRTALELSSALEGSIEWMDIWKVFLGGLSQPGISRCDPWEGTCYMGITALFFLPAGFIAVPRRLRIGLVLSLLFAILCTLGSDGGLYPLLFRFIPGWSTLNMPNRSLVMAAIALPILSAYGFQTWFDVKSLTLKTRIFWAVVAFLSLTSLLVLYWIYPFIGISLINPSMTRTFQPELISDSQWAILSFTLWTGLTVLAVLVLTMEGVSKKLALFFLLILLGAQSALYSQRLFLQTTSSDYFNPTRTVRLVEKNLDESGYRVCSYVPMIDSGSDVRMALLRPSFLHRLPEVDRLPEIQGYDPLFPKRYGELLREWAGHSRATDRTRTLRMETLPPSLLDFLSVSTIVGYPNQENLYSGRAVELDEPGGLQSRLKQPKQVESVTLRWLLAGASEIPQGALVARIHVLNASHTIQSFPVRAGIEIANYITQYPNAPISHKPATEYRWFPVPSRFGYMEIRQYSAVFPLDRPAVIDQVSIEYLSPVGRLAILEMNYQTSDVMDLQLISASSELPVYQNPDAFPPAYLTRRIMRYRRLEEMIDIFRSRKPGEEIPVFFSMDEDIAFDASPVAVLQPEMDVAQYERLDSDRIKVQTRSKFDGLLVITENYSPNWSAKVDGQEVPVFRANYSFLAIPIAAGEHEVQLEYLPRLFFISISISGSMLAFMILLLAMYPRHWLLPPHPQRSIVH